MAPQGAIFLTIPHRKRRRIKALADSVPQHFGRFPTFKHCPIPTVGRHPSRHRATPLPKCPQLPLTDIACKNANCSEGRACQRFADSGGLHLEVTATGSKLWRWKYRFNGKEKRLAIVSYPEVTLAGATCIEMMYAMW